MPKCTKDRIDVGRFGRRGIDADFSRRMTPASDARKAPPDGAFLCAHSDKDGCGRDFLGKKPRGALSSLLLGRANCKRRPDAPASGGQGTDTAGLTSGHCLGDTNMKPNRTHR